jgi:hypothetical protein
MDITVEKYKKEQSVLGDFVGFYVYLRDEKGKTQSVSVNCSNTLKAVWRLNDDDELFNSLYPLIRKELVDHFSKGIFEEINEIVPFTFSTYNSPSKPPSERSSFPDVINVKHSSSKALPCSTYVESAKPKISILRYDIAELRDSINTIFDKDYGFRLFRIEQERAIVDMYMPCSSKDEYISRIAALRGLLSWTNKDSIKDKLKIKKVEKGQMSELEYLERFLKQEFPEYNKNMIIDRLKSLKKIFVGYPIHKDGPRVLEGYRELNIDYPVKDYSSAWEKILKFYEESLKALLLVIKRR